MSIECIHATNDGVAGFPYRRALRALNRARIPFLVGGTYALERYAGFSRGTKDLDLFVLERDWPHIVEALEGCGFQTDLAFSHWLGKARFGSQYVDFVFAGGNGLVRVAEDWFGHGVVATIHGEHVLVCAVEEVIWSKAFVMERERFDGADVLHMVRKVGHSLDWNRLLHRFGQHWRILLAHIVVFDFVYPGERQAVPPWVRESLFARAAEEPSPRPQSRLCRGTLLSRSQYVVDVEAWGYADARLLPEGTMTQKQIDDWTAAASREGSVVPYETEAS